jgi:hypothetical protein
MKAIYQGVADILLKDDDLRNMVGYTAALKNIRRGFGLQGEWEKLVVFYLQPEFPITDFCASIRIVPLIVRVYDRVSDLNTEDMAERLILLLDGCDLSVPEELFCYDCSYRGDLVPVGWNEELKTFEKIMRFDIQFRVDAVAGKSGLPVRKRK